mmetsp:Transcript_30335/g.61786  ORF Transcript_30335/g.61786 Transcript_30335/m.61786 type:complete len:222 (+) Transcript_30335:413-1078(+)
MICRLLSLGQTTSAFERFQSLLCCLALLRSALDSELVSLSFVLSQKLNLGYSVPLMEEVLLIPLLAQKEKKKKKKKKKKKGYSGFAHSTPSWQQAKSRQFLVWTQPVILADEEPLHPLRVAEEEKKKKTLKSYSRMGVADEADQSDKPLFAGSGHCCGTGTPLSWTAPLLLPYLVFQIPASSHTLRTRTREQASFHTPASVFQHPQYPSSRCSLQITRFCS